MDSYRLTFVVIVSIDEIKTLSCYKTDCFLFLLSWVNIEIAVNTVEGMLLANVHSMMAEEQGVQ